MAIGRNVEKICSLGLSVVAFGVVLAILVLGKSFLVPLAIAILLWHLLEALINDLGRLAISRFRLPRWLAKILAIGLIVLFLCVIIIVLLSQADAIANAWPRYAERMKSIIAGLADWFGEGPSAKLRQELDKIDVARQAADLFTSVQSLMINIVVVFFYVAFLFVEHRYINDKLGALFPDTQVARDMEKMLSAISLGIRRYVWIKTLMGVIIGVASYAVLRAMGVDFAETCALLIFLLYYIPYVGSALGVVFPALFTLVQFDTNECFLGVAFGLSTIYAIVGNFVEPMVMGKSLNMSTFAIFLSLAFWGTIWGIVGMFLGVPIMVVTMIICANMPSWRWASILLSKDGRISNGSG
ncbi:MAG: AI-2E family transporter [Xanthobacteraceae bacterium]